MMPPLLPPQQQKKIQLIFILPAPYINQETSTLPTQDISRYFSSEKLPQKS